MYWTAIEIHLYSIGTTNCYFDFLVGYGFKKRKSEALDHWINCDLNIDQLSGSRGAQWNEFHHIKTSKMQSTLILCCGLCVVMALGYYVLFGLFRLLEALMKNSGQSLKTVAILLTLLGLVYIIINRNEADHMLFQVQDLIMFWEDDMVFYDKPLIH